jgi:hypothetical protein
MFVMKLRHKSLVISPHSWIIVALKSMRFAALVGNTFSFTKSEKKKLHGIKLGLRGDQK